MNVTTVMCACTDCRGVVATTAAVEHDGRFHCSAACADGHRDCVGCHHAACTCHS